MSICLLICAFFISTIDRICRNMLVDHIHLINLYHSSKLHGYKYWLILDDTRHMALA
jgi:hypothetical protein